MVLSLPPFPHAQGVLGFKFLLYHNPSTSVFTLLPSSVFHPLIHRVSSLMFVYPLSFLLPMYFHLSALTCLHVHLFLRPFIQFCSFVFLSLCLTVPPSLFHFVFLFFSPSVSLTLYLCFFVLLPLSLSVLLFLRPLTCCFHSVSICLSIHLSYFSPPHLHFFFFLFPPPPAPLFLKPPVFIYPSSWLSVSQPSVFVPSNHRSYIFRFVSPQPLCLLSLSKDSYPPSSPSPVCPSCPPLIRRTSH